MSFRARLTLFFLLIVIVPMASLTFVLFRLIADNEQGKADAGLAARQQVVLAGIAQARRTADAQAVAIGGDERLAAALRAGDAQAAARRASALLDVDGARRIVVTRGDGVLVDVGSQTAVFPAARRLTDRDGSTFGVLQVSTQGPTAFVRTLGEQTALDVVLRRDGRTLAATRDALGTVDLPARRGDVDVGGQTLRAATSTTPGFGRSELTVSVLASEAATRAEVREGRLLAGGVLLGFFLLALAFAVAVSRSLQRQIGDFLQAARRLAQGDFSVAVPTVGNDEFAALGVEFNRMSEQLDARLRDLAAERARLAEAMKRIGDTFASNLDRDALLEIVLASALDGTGATAGRARLGDGTTAPPVEVARVGTTGALGGVLERAESAVLRGDAHLDADAFALAHPLRAHRAAGEEDLGPLRGVVAIAREDRAFTRSEAELFHYLAGQASVSVENVGLHEAVERQAVTDSLTGLANRRRFEAVLQREVERSKRFDGPVALVMLDIDDFKRVNDTYGHQVGDEVLRAVSEVLRASCREIDEPARYGGEELAVVLPGTDLEGAVQLAERVRLEIAALDIDAGGGDRVRVTASLGAATRPGAGDDVDTLVEAADHALYDAKRAGKDRVVAAEPVGRS